MMFGQDVAAMIEAHNAAVWEEINEEPEIDRAEIRYQLGEALDDLSEVYESLAAAWEESEGHESHSRIHSLMCDIESIEIDIKKLRNQLEKEVKSA